MYPKSISSILLVKSILEICAMEKINPSCYSVTGKWYFKIQENNTRIKLRQKLHTRII